MEPDDLLCSRNAHWLVCLVGWSFSSVWFFWMNFSPTNQTNQIDETDQMNQHSLDARTMGNHQAALQNRERVSLKGIFSLPDAHYPLLYG